jgi:hypothetical protein
MACVHQWLEEITPVFGVACHDYVSHGNVAESSGPRIMHGMNSEFVLDLQSHS